MKKIAALIITASFVIAACMLYLVKKGISLTPAVLIKPSTFEGPGKVATSVVQRLFPQFSEDPSWQIKNTALDTQEITNLILSELQKSHPTVKTNVTDALPDESLLAAESEPHLYVQKFRSSDFPLSGHCENMKRLDYKCFVEVSLHKSRRKMKDTSVKYFMMTSYLDKHYLLLIQE